ncbi:FadR/GntR family transcriptional regulator [Occultella aeris]|uniref:HTH-type transcriptional regulator LutR n=1 Tax=Occultella aeris TaxID=2761496 RepID=A0A7M4DFI3_9MICO|nr:FadR/GntR family transcriptional regulator [Occultella aeris]VZO35676.1 HTH-type transcriptional regulator LutR [Occultella aeris]
MSPGSGSGEKVLLGAGVAERIAEHIRSESLVEGDPLPSEGALAETYGVSQRVVRDALRLLSQQGVIWTRQGKRAVVSTLRPVAVLGYFQHAVAGDAAAIHELLELRQAIETQAAGAAAQRMQADDLVSLSELLDRAEAEAVTSSARVESDLAFHRAIVRFSGNRFFDGILDVLTTTLTEERRRGQEITEQAGGTHDTSDREHRAILLALQARDSALVEQAMRTHLDRVRQAFLDTQP